MKRQQRLKFLVGFYSDFEGHASRNNLLKKLTYLIKNINEIAQLIFFLTKAV
jgi:hypothetical protein